MNKKQIGRIGENIACKFLINNGFEIIDQNYQKRIGEIDIIAFKKGTFHFFEVKTVSRETFNTNNNAFKNRNHNPEDNVTHEKINKIEKTAKIFMKQKGFTDEYVQIDLLTVYLLSVNLESVLDENKIDNIAYTIKYFPNINF